MQENAKMRESARKCAKMCENARKCVRMRENARKCATMSDSARKCAKLHDGLEGGYHILAARGGGEDPAVILLEAPRGCTPTGCPIDPLSTPLAPRQRWANFYDHPIRFHVKGPLCQVDAN